MFEWHHWLAGHEFEQALGVGDRQRSLTRCNTCGCKKSDMSERLNWSGDCSHEIKRCLLIGRKTMTSLDSILKKQRHYFANKGLSSQSYGFSSSHVWMWDLDHKESWVPKNWWFWTVVMENTLESPLDCKEIKPFNLKGNQSWIFTGKADAKAEASILWPPDMKSWHTGKRSWCWKRLKEGGEGDNRRWVGWVVSPILWTSVWATWWAGKPGVL